LSKSGRTVLDPRASAASAKQVFGEDELTAILRFGAEELFKARARQYLGFLGIKVGVFRASMIKRTTLRAPGRPACALYGIWCS
jgi:hypothetical protein